MKPTLSDPGRAHAAIGAGAIPFALCLAASVFWLLPGSASAQSGGGYDLSWNSIDAGGQRSIGGEFVLDGVIGQPDAAVLSGGAYTLHGGFLAFSDDLRSASAHWELYD